MDGTTRRRLLGSVTVGASALACCADSSGDDGGTTASDATDTEATGDDLDLREANVTAVGVESAGGGRYECSVTLYHDVRESYALTSQPEREAFW